MRKAFSMITAIFVIVLMATIGAFILNISAKSIKSTVLQFKREQAILYARSYTEAAIMKASANAAGTTLTGSIDDYDITATITPVLSPAQLIVALLTSKSTINVGNGSIVISFETLAIQPLASLT